MDLVVRDGQLQGRDEERGRKDSGGENVSFYKQNPSMIKRISWTIVQEFEWSRVSRLFIDNTNSMLYGIFDHSQHFFQNPSDSPT